MKTFVVMVAAWSTLLAGTAAAATHWTPGAAASSTANAHGKGFDPPTGGSAGSATSNSLTISWTAPASGATPASYVVYRSTSSGGTYTELTSGGCAAPATSGCVDNDGLLADTPYYYEVHDVLDNWTTSTASFSGTTTAGIELIGSCGENITTNTTVENAACSVAAEQDGTSLTLHAPSTVTMGDLLIAQVTARVDSAPSTPSGWTQIGAGGTNSPTGEPESGSGASYYNTTIFQYVYYHVVVSGDSSSSTWTWNGWSGDADATGGILEFSGVSTTTPVDVSGYTYCPSQGGTGCTMPWSTATAPAVTTTKADDEVVALFASGGSEDFNSNSATYGGEDGATNEYSATSDNTTGGQGANYESDAAAVVTTSVQSAAGSTGTFTLKLASANSIAFSWIASTIALEP